MRPGTKLIAAALWVFALAQWTLLSFQIPVFHSLPGWVYFLDDIPLAHGWVFVLMLLAAVGATAVAARDSGRTCVGLCLLVALGYGTQMGFVVMEGRGLTRQINDLDARGHGEFAIVAAGEPSMWRVLTQYESLIQDGKLGAHPNPKPPGQLLLYMLNHRLANALKPEPTADARLERAVLLIPIVWPLITFLCVFPLYLFARLFMGKPEAMVACLLYTCAPNVATLNNLCLDKVLYPTLCMLALWLVVQAYRRGSFAWALAAGAMLFASTFVTFSLVVLFPLSVLLLAADHVCGPRPWREWRPAAKALLGIGASVLALGVLCWLCFGYNALYRFRFAMAYHAECMAWQPTVSRVAYCASLNFLEFGFYIGAPLAVLFVASIVRAARASIARKADALDGACLAMCAILVLVGVFGRTMSETSRLWLFMVPLFCTFAAKQVSLVWADSRRVGAVTLVLIQLVTALLIVRY